MQLAIIGNNSSCGFSKHLGSYVHGWPLTVINGLRISCNNVYLYIYIYNYIHRHITLVAGVIIPFIAVFRAMAVAKTGSLRVPEPSQEVSA